MARSNSFFQLDATTLYFNDDDNPRGSSWADYL